MQKTTISFIKKLPEIIGVGIGMGLLSILIPYTILSILASSYEPDFESLYLRWSIICIVLTIVYYWDKEGKIDIKK